MSGYHNLDDSHETYTVDFALPKIKEELRIVFDVEGIHKALSMTQPTTMSLAELENVITKDFEVSKQSYQDVQREVRCSLDMQISVNHKYEDLILLNFEEMSHIYLLDGKHRYFEHKFQNKQTISVKTINSFEAYKYIVCKKDFLIYAIAHNLAILIKYANGSKDALNELIHIEDYL